MCRPRDATNIQHAPKTSNHWVSKSIISWIRKPRSFLRKPSVTGLRPLSSLAPTDILTAHTVPVRCCLPTEAHSVFRRQAEAAVFQPSALTPPACGNLFSPWFMPFFFLLFCLEPCQTLGSNSPISPNPWVTGRKSELVERPVLIMWERKWLTRLYGNVHTFQLLPPKRRLCS